MSDIRTNPLQATAVLTPHLWWLAVISIAVCLAAFAAPTFGWSLALFSAATTLLVLICLVASVGWGSTIRARMADRTIGGVFETDPDVVFTTTENGELVWSNDRARSEYGILDGAGVIAALSPFFADPGGSFARALGTTRARGHWSSEPGAGRSRQSLTAQRAGSQRVLWRLATTEPQPDLPAAPEAMLRLHKDDSGALTWISPSLRRQLDSDASTISDLLRPGPLKSGRLVDLHLAGAHERCAVSVFPLERGAEEVILQPIRVRDDGIQFDGLPVPLAQIGSDGTIQVANQLARQLLCLTEDETPALANLVEGLGRPVADWLDDAFQGRALQRPEVVRASRSDADVYVQITLDRIGSGDDAQMIAVLHDATEMKTLEAQFVQSQKMQAIGQLAGGVAHDFNNLLTAISGHCDLLLLRHDAGDQDFADLEQINQNANRAASLVGQLLAFSRKQNLRPEPLDLRDILSDLTHLLNRLVGERITLYFDHDPALQMVRADKRQLEQVIMNLVVNARDAMPQGGGIRIRTETRHLTTPLSRDRVDVPAGSYVLVQVIDEGEGIAEDKVTKIFEPFFTTKRAGEGTGLGLSTAYGIVKQTGGYIFADSTPGEGACFSLYFPAFERPAQAAEKLEAPKENPMGRQGEGTILLVEDEAPVRAFAARALRLRGYTVLEAEHAEAALELLEDASLMVDVFVTDVIMPGRDGPSWVREALLSRPDTKVIFVSGYAEESFAENQAKIPNSLFLPKPFSLVDLTTTVQKQLDG